MRREEKARIRRREMLAACYEVLLDEGLTGASVAKIAARAGVPPSLLRVGPERLLRSRRRRPLPK
jgi:AcrR family transcriptional regulator